MSVIDCREHHKGRGSVLKTGRVYTYTAQWIVSTNDKLDGSKTVVDYVEQHHAPLDSHYSHGNDVDKKAKLKSLKPSLLQEEDDRKTWVVTASWETETDAAGSGEKGKSEAFKDRNGNLTRNPLAQFDRVDVGEATFQRPAEKAVYRSGLVGMQAQRRAEGTTCAITNSAFVQFQPIPMKDDVREIIRITRSLAEWPDELAVKLRKTVNSKLILVDKPWVLYRSKWLKHTVRCESITGSFQFANDVRYWDVTATFSRDRDGWREFYLDKGVHAAFGAGLPDENGEVVSMTDARLKDGAPPVRRLLDANGVPVTEEVRLDGNGQPLALDKPDVFLEYSKYDEDDWFKLLLLGFFV